MGEDAGTSQSDKGGWEEGGLRASSNCTFALVHIEVRAKAMSVHLQLIQTVSEVQAMC